MSLQRRLLSIARTYAAAVVIAGLWPLLAVVALLIDLRRKPRWVSLRLLAFCTWYLAVEAWMLPQLGMSWLRWRHKPADLLRDTARLQERFAGLLFTALRRLFALRLEVEHAELARLGPVIVLVRHTSVADTLLPTVLLSHGQGMRLRFVLKQELLADPCLDIAGNRLPNLFVTRNRARAAEDLAAIRQLATGLGESDGVLIYPEGTRFTPTKQQQALASLRKEGSPHLELAETWSHVLPPKPGGVLAALAGAPDADVVWMTHTGLEGLADLAAIWRGGLVGQTVKVNLRRTLRRDIPDTPEAQVRWLFAEWDEVNTWVAAHLPGDTEARQIENDGAKALHPHTARLTSTRGNSSTYTV